MFAPRLPLRHARQCLRTRRLRDAAGCAGPAGERARPARGAGRRIRPRRPSPTRSASRVPPEARRRRRTPSALRSFADVSRDAKELTGPLPRVAKGRQGLAGDRTGAVRPAVLLFHEPGPGTGREAASYGGSMSSSLSRRFGAPVIVTFRKVGTNVQLIARNVKYTAQAGTPEARAVADGFSDSLISQRRHRVAAAPRTQVGAGGGQFAVLRPTSRARRCASSRAIGRPTPSTRATRSSGRCAARRRSFR